jgi:predicted nucleic acid-binding protein
MKVFLDTSALYCLADESEDRHGAASEAWLRLLRGGHDLIVHNYVLVEFVALLHKRLGKAAVLHRTEDLMAPVEVRWIIPTLHAEGMASYRESGRKDTSLVDHMSFAVMRSERIGTAFAFDDDFRRAGFETIP